MIIFNNGQMLQSIENAHNRKTLVNGCFELSVDDVRYELYVLLDVPRKKIPSRELKSLSQIIRGVLIRLGFDQVAKKRYRIQIDKFEEALQNERP